MKHVAKNMAESVPKRSVYGELKDKEGAEGGRSKENVVGDHESDWSNSLLMWTSRREVLIGSHCLDCVLRPV